MGSQMELGDKPDNFGLVQYRQLVCVQEGPRGIRNPRTEVNVILAGYVIRIDNTLDPEPENICQNMGKREIEVDEATPSES